MENYIKRFLQLIIGLFIFAFGLVLCIHANIGLAPWEAFSIGISNVTGISYGNVSIMTGLVILLVLVSVFKEKIGFGTIFNTVLIGAYADFIISLKVIPYMTNYFSGLLMLIAGQILVAYASYLYISVGMCPGPRDTLMVALGKRLPKVPIGIVRSLIEGFFLSIGWLLGAKVGLGTVIYVFGIGFTVQITFKVLKFDVKSVVHESVPETISALKQIRSERIY